MTPDCVHGSARACRGLHRADPGRLPEDGRPGHREGAELAEIELVSVGGSVAESGRLGAQLAYTAIALQLASMEWSGGRS